MIMEGNETLSGWPLGLGIMSSRINGVVDAADQPPAPPPPPPRGLRSSSFSSFSSSNLDTQSTASFFPDQSVSLGRLIGIKPMNKGSFYGHRNVGDHDERSSYNPMVHKDQRYNSQGLCVPLMYHLIGRMSCTCTSRN